MKASAILLFVSMTICFLSCKDEEAVLLTPDDYNYFPVEYGSWIVYDVDSIVHLDIDDQTNQPDTSVASYHYQVKETIDSSFLDGEGETAFRIIRETRMSDTLPWDFQSVWTCKRNANSAQKVEDNVRFVKLSFPVNTHSTWNGNAFNNLPGEEYSFEQVHQPLAVGPYFFDSTLTVNQLEFISLINRIIRKETYARKVGMVSKQRDSLNINGLGEVINGIEYTQTINNYGR